ncbi:putative baseplate assembly protein [Streptomyces cinnamoneus]|uniref:Baseplate protein J-like barrel domain-containing protein n=1 Tax=Streptomyces cinnamoneus TaxID=53446 RepID=A0A918TFQ0_STRCJ|nr:putative baseplate assembly protein [Streptomyces cinnamoneus]GHC44356.1 hypothetical protein GCM10010507_19180 [Streptomyces cinnamoneus]
MTLPTPDIDGRGRADITGAAAAAVRALLPAWTGQDRADPGHALIECCADMTGALRDRLNGCPDRHRLELLRMLGVHPHRAAPARAEVVFQLAAPSPEPVPVPAGVEVSTRPVREDEEPVVFSTVTDALVNPCVLITAGDFTQTGATDGAVEGSLAAFGPGQPDTVEPRGLPFAGPPYHLNLPWFGDFSSGTGGDEPPEPGADGVLVVLSVPVPDTRITVDLAFPLPDAPAWQDPTGAPDGEDGEDGEAVWEAWQGSDWVPCRTVTRTAGADGAVRVTLELPANHAPTELRLHLFRPGAPAVPWRLRDVGLLRRRSTWEPGPAEVLLQPVLTAKVPVVQALLVRDEHLGRALGVPGERLRFTHPPLRPAADTLAVEAVTGTGTLRWVHVPSLAGSGPHDRHFTLDPRTWEAVFAPVTRTARGPRRHGAPLPPGATVRAPRYLTGGGARGNVPARTITALRTPLPYVAAVTNPAPATGGTEAETPEAYARRLPLGSPVPERAVTPHDYEELALAASAGMARIHLVGDADDALDPAHNYRMPVPARTQVRFRLEPGVTSVPGKTRVRTEDGKVFTTHGTASRGAVRPADLARLTLDPAATAAHDLFTAGDFLTHGPVSGPFRTGGGLVLALVHVPAEVDLKELTLWVKPNRAVAAGERMALSLFLPRTGVPWWNPEAPAAYASAPAASITLGGKSAALAHPLPLAGSPRWRPDSDRPADRPQDAVKVRGKNYPGAGGSWLALQIRDPKGNDKTTYTVHLDDGTTGPVRADQYVTKKAGPVPHGGEPGESIALMEGRLGELPKVLVGGEPWEPRTSFAASDKHSKHVVINAATGQVHFGPEIREAGRSVRHGEVPAKGTPVTVTSYNSTLGRLGNGIPKDRIRVVDPPVHGVRAVWNTEESSGGDDGYTDTSGGTFQVGVRLLVVPYVTADDRGWFPFHMLTPGQDACDVLRRALRARQPAGVPVWLDTPDYQGIRVEAHVVPTDYRTTAERAALAAAAERALYRWFSPVDGGPDGTGWPLGRPVHAGEPYRVLERVPGVARVASLRLFEADPRSGRPTGEVAVVPCGDRQTVYCVAHRVTVAETP